MSATTTVRRLAYLAASAAVTSDAELLKRYVCTRDSDAFAALVDRHGPMVLGVCHRVTRDPHSAEDCFQAAFLMLARRAASIRSPEALPAWLFGTARRVSLRARQRLGRHTTTPLPDVQAPSIDPLDALSARELLIILDDELARLPAKYRSALILCCLEGMPVDAAAKYLGSTRGAVRGWLQRGRDRLRIRLERRGLAPTSLLALAVVSKYVPSAALAAGAKRFATSPSSATAAIASLSTRQTVTGKFVGLLGLTAAAIVGIGFALFAAQGAPPEDKKSAKEANDSPQIQEKAANPRVDRYGDPLPEGVLARLGTMRMRHGENSFAMAYSPDGKELASAGTDGIIHVWDLATGKERLRIDLVKRSALGSYSVQQVAFSPDGRYLAATQTNQPPALWDSQTGKKIRQFGGDSARSDRVQFSPDGKYLSLDNRGQLGRPQHVYIASVETGEFTVSLGQGTILFAGGKDQFIFAAADGKVSLHGLPGGAELRQFKSGESTTSSTAVSGDGTRLFTVGKDKVVRAWDVSTGTELARFDGAGDETRYVIADTKGKLVLTIHNEWDRIALWDTSTGKRRWEAKLDAKRDKVSAAVFLPNGEILTGHYYGMMRAWNPTTGREARAIRPQSWGQVVLALAPDGKTVATVVNDRGDVKIVLTDTATFKPTLPDRGHETQVKTAAFRPDGKVVATGSWDGTVRLWEPRTGKALRTIEAEPMGTLAYSPDGKRLYASGWSDGKVRTYDADTGKVVREWDSGSKHLWMLALSGDGRVLVTAGDTARAWNTVDGTLLREFEPKSVTAYIAISADGKTLASTGLDGALRVLDARTGQLKHTVTSKTGRIGAFAISPDGNLLAWHDTEGNYVTEMATGRLVRALVGRPSGSDMPLFSPDGKTLAWGEWQTFRGARIWDVRTGQLRRTLHGHDGWGRTLAFSPDGSLLLTAGPDGAVLVWDIHGRESPSSVATPTELAEWWAALAVTDSEKAYKAMANLRDAGPSAVALIREKLAVVARPDAKRVAAWAADLESDSFKVREAATREFSRLGESALPTLRDIKANGKSEEVRNRAGRLLEAIEEGRMVPERAVEVLEMIADTKATELLAEYAAGQPDAPLTLDAAGAIKRLKLK